MQRASPSARAAPRTMLDKLWREHVIAELGDGTCLLHVDRHFLHELSGAMSFQGIERAGRRVRDPSLTYATVDHVVDTTPGRTDRTLIPNGSEFIAGLRKGCAEHGVRLFDLDDPRQGIVHVVAPELGVALPGTTIVCGDSHTCTLGGMGALAWGIGSTDGEHVLATQSIVQTRPMAMRVSFAGTAAPGIVAKDLVMSLIGAIGADGGNGFAVEFAGPAVGALSIDGRLTLCNMAVELSARAGFVVPDDVTFEYLCGRPFAPSGALWDRAVAAWRELASDEGAVFDREVTIDCAGLEPQVTWGTSPEHVVGIGGAVPDPASAASADARHAMERALAYMDLRPGMRVKDLDIQAAFIGSCTNSRLSDLREAAAILRGRRVAPGVSAICTPGSSAVKRAAEAEGIGRVFREAGFEWREPGCSLCMSGGAGGERFPAHARVATSTNRNFENRQGPGVRSHLASPATVAASAIAGRLADPREISR